MLQTQRLNRKYAVLLVAIFGLAFLFGSGCGGKWDCWGGTRETAKKTYKGTKGATAPHDSTKMSTLGMGCDKNYCDYAVTATVALHNPTSRGYTVDIHCEYWLGENYLAQKSKRTGIKVEAGPCSKYVELQQIVGAPTGNANTIGVKCDVSWK